MQRRKFWSISIWLAAGLVALASFFPAPVALAQAQEGKQGFHGIVTAAAGDTVTVTREGTALALKADASTKVAVPGVEKPTLADVAVGQRVAVLAERRADGLYILKIQAIPAEPKDKHLTLTIVEAAGKTIIAETSTGQQVVVETEFELRGDLKGQLITFVGEQPESNRFKAKAAMKLENVVARLDKQVKEKDAEARAERDPSAQETKRRSAEELRVRLEANLKAHLDRFAEIIAKAPPEARPALEQALASFKTSAVAALRAIDRPPQEVSRATEQHSLKGTVESVDAAAGQVALRSRGDARLVLKAGTATEIRLGEAPGTLAEVRPGDLVEVRFRREGNELLRLRVILEAEAEGRIKALDGATRTVTLELEGNASLVLKLVDATRIEVNDRPAAVGDLAVGMKVEAKYNPRTLEALRIKGKLEARFILVVDSLDAAARTITGKTEEGRTLTVKVTDNTRVEARGALSSLFGLKAGSRLAVELNPATGEALKIKVQEKDEEAREKAKAQGTVVRLEAPARKLTIRLSDKSELTVAVARDAEIEVEGKEATLDALKEGLPVKVEYNPQTLVATEVEVEREAKELARPTPEVKRSERGKVEGTVTAVDAARGTITVFTGGGESRVIVVKPDTSMALNERRIAALAELPVGAAVKVEHTEGNVAVKIVAERRAVATPQREEKEKEESEVRRETRR